MNKLLIIILSISFACPLSAQVNLASMIDVSIIQLIANPEKFKNKTVALCGYYQYDDVKTYEERYIYLTREYASLGDNSNAIPISPRAFDKTKGNAPSGLYVRLIAVVDNYEGDEKDLKKIYIKEIYQMTGYVLDKSELSRMKPEGILPIKPEQAEN